MSRLIRKGIFSLFASLLSVFVLAAQSNCPELVTQALSAVDDNCNATGRNEACYGYDQVEASFLTTVADDFFTLPANLAPVAELETLRTAPLNTETGVWGVALMNLQADLPNTLPGQTVTFLLLGDVEIENAIAPDEAFVGSEGVEVTVNVAAGANLRSGAGTNFNVIGGVRNGETLLADGLSQDGQWLRIVYRNRPAWISRSVINDTIPALRDLPTLTSDLRTPMQSFFLRTGIGQPACEEAPPDGLMVQGPENIEIQLTVNGADVRLGSSGMFRVVEVDGEFFLEILVFDGEFEVGGVTIRRGQHSLLCLGDANSRGLDGEDNDLVVTCDPTTPERMEMGEWCVLEDVSADILNYGLDVPCPGETPPANTGSRGGGATQSQVSGVNCSGFGLISPLFPVDAGTHTFSWSPATGDNITYQLVFYNYAGTEVESFYTTATSHAVNLGAETQTGGSFFWEVRAYQNGVYACVSFRSPQLTRTADADVAPVGANISVSISCTYVSSTYNATITWSGLPNGETLTAVLNSTPYGMPSQNSSSASGTINLSVYSFASAQVNVTTSGGFQQTKNC